MAEENRAERSVSRPAPNIIIIPAKSTSDVSFVLAYWV
ncbi:unnamed protein product, partial [marine sediment metagenome]